MLKKKTVLFMSSLILFLGMFAFVELIETDGVKEFRLQNESSIVDPLSFISLYLLMVSTILLFFNDTIFNRWLKKIVLWFAPVSIVLILSGTSGNSYTWLTRTDLSIFVGQALVFITLVFALLEKFYYKIK